MLLVDLDVGIVGEQGLHELVGGHEIVKSDQGNGVLYTGIVGIKGDDVVHAHVG